MLLARFALSRNRSVRETPVSTTCGTRLSRAGVLFTWTPLSNMRLEAFERPRVKASKADAQRSRSTILLSSLIPPKRFL